MDQVLRQGGSAPGFPAPTQLVLIEDEAGIRRSLQLLLHGRHFDVHAFPMAELALADPASMTATHLVIDYALPDGDGIHVLQAFRARGWAGVAVMITAFYTEELASRAREAGFAAVLPKPFRDNLLLDALLRGGSGGE